jgi:uncharacterized membrane protein
MMDESQLFRFWELDFMRGLAVIMMVLHHLLYDMYYFGGCSFEVLSGFWRHFAQATAAIFIILVGISLTLSASKAIMRGSSDKLYLIFLKRGLKIFLLGMTITLITYLLIGRGFVLFGVLHFIGASILLAYPFLKLRSFNLFAGLVFILIGLYLQDLTFHFSWLLWLGFIPDNFYTLDYFPIFPWFGLVLIGLYLGNSLYPGRRRNFYLPNLSNFLTVKLLINLGKNSLLVYLVHQPALVTILFLTGMLQ